MRLGAGATGGRLAGQTRRSPGRAQFGVAVAVLTMALLGVAPWGAAGESAEPNGADPPQQTEETVLRERAEVYWQARFTQDLQRALTFEDPVRQKRLSLIAYIRQLGEPGKIYLIAVKGVKIQGDQADVEVEMTLRYTIPPWNKAIVTTTLTDDWQKIDGVWYHVLDLHMIRDGKPRANVERGTIEYPTAELPRKGSGNPGSTGAATETPEPQGPRH